MAELSLEMKLKLRYGIDITRHIDSVEYVTTGDEEFDKMLGGGLPRGRIIELYGKPGSGKGCFVLSFVKAWVEEGGWSFWSDAEHVFDPDFAAGYGLEQNEDFIVFQPSTLEDEFGAFYDTVQGRGGGLFVLDSLAAEMPRLEADARGSVIVGHQALVIGQNLKRFPHILAQAGSTFIVINQIRTGIRKNKWSPQEVTPGGDSLKFFASIRMRCRKVSQSKSLIVRGRRTQPMVSEVKIIKNKCGGAENISAQFIVVPGFSMKFRGGYKELELKGGKEGAS